MANLDDFVSDDTWLRKDIALAFDDGRLYTSDRSLSVCVGSYQSAVDQCVLTISRVTITGGNHVRIMPIISVIRSIGAKWLVRAVDRLDELCKVL